MQQYQIHRIFPDLGPGHDAWLRELLASLVSTLLVIPDNPEEGVLFLIKTTLNTINKYSWDRHQDHRSLALLAGVRLLCAATRETYPYSYQVRVQMTREMSRVSPGRGWQ